MAASYFFYDLETSGISPRDARIMQFAGQRTDMDLNPVGEPINILIKLTADVIPEPDAIIITGITPQQTQAEGVTEAEFLQIFYKEVVKPGTIFAGFNTIRFDDEFMRFLHYRNFYDAYEWQWCDDCSRWDILDVVRMTRALRPDGIEWPFAPDGKPSNRLELLTSVNGLTHDHAHDALNDVHATIAVAKLIRTQNHDLYEYLLAMRQKKKVQELVEAGKPFVYTSGRYSSQYMHTSAATLVAKHAVQGVAYVYDLRYDPTDFLAMDIDQLLECAKFSRDPAHRQLPVKPLRYNRCPAVAPLGVMKDAEAQKRIDLSLDTIQSNYSKFAADKHFGSKISEVFQRMESERPMQKEMFGSAQEVDTQLYDGFIPNQDKATMHTVRSANPEDCAALDVEFADKRLQTLFPLYKARNHPKCLSDEDRAAWDEFCKHRLLDGGQSSRLAKFFKRLEELAKSEHLSKNQRFALEELHLYGESIMPVIDEAA